MGMDVYGKNPKNESGKYFRANCWSWRPIHTLIQSANNICVPPLINEKTLDSMNYNDGAGLKDQESCDLLADKLENLITDIDAMKRIFSKIEYDKDSESHVFYLDLGTYVDRKGRFADSGDDLVPAYWTNTEHVQKFITFLRNCGGFEVN